MKALITGGAGFVGHHLVEHLIRHTDMKLVVFDKLSYAGNFDRLRDIDCFNTDRVQTLTVDFSQPLSEGVRREIGHPDVILHVGAESHVDRSIERPAEFVTANVYGTLNMLDYALSVPGLKCFYYFSTDEVFGPAPDGVLFREDDPHNPRNPYAATKSAAEMLVKAWRNTYRVPAVITRSMNIFGERQHPEKFVPTVIRKVLAGECVTIHADPARLKAGSRFYIHARNVADGYLFLLDNAIRDGDYHITGSEEVDNLRLARMIADILGKPLDYEMVDFHSSRPGHDLRYALSGEKMAERGWTPPKDFVRSLEKTVQWSVEHPAWL